jgi:hypothetical protein
MKQATSTTRRAARSALAASILTLAAAGCVSPPAASPTVPGVPLTLAVGSCFGGLQSIGFQAPASDGGSPIIEYRVSRNMAPTSSVGLNSQPAFPCADNTAFYQVVACNSVGCGAATDPTAYVP